MELTALITQSAQGNVNASDELYQMLYADLKSAAHRIRFRWNNVQTLNTTALVHESYLKVLNSEQITPQSRLHFYHLCGRAMRYILQDYVERKNAQKRGGDYQHVELDDDRDHIRDSAENPMLNDLMEAVKKLEQEDSLLYQIVECRFFSDLSIQDTAGLLGISPATVKRKWIFARAYLTRNSKK